MISLAAILDGPYAANAYAVPNAAAALCLSAIGVNEYLGDRGSRLSLTTSLFTGLMGLYFLGFAAALCAASPQAALAWMRLAYLAVIFFPAVIFAMLMHSLDLGKSIGVWQKVIAAATAVFLAADLSGDSLVAGVRPMWWGYSKQYGFMGWLFVAFVVAVAAACLWAIASKLRRTRRGSVTHRRLRFLMANSLVLCLAGVDFLPAMGIPCYPFGYLPVVAFAAMLLYSRLRYQANFLRAFLAADEILLAMKEAIFLLDEDGSVVLTNPAAQALLGLDADAIRGRGIAGLLPLPFFRQDLWAALHDRELPDFEFAVTLASGTTANLSASMSLVRDRLGLELGVAVLLSDVSARRQAEHRLREVLGGLENQVALRTAELTAANAKLIAEIGERERAEQAIKRSLEEKTLMLKEIHHRVKNNLQIIISLLSLQSAHSGGKHETRALGIMEGRIRSMALVHERLYHSDNLDALNMADHLADLASSISLAQRDCGKDIRIAVEADPLILDIERAIPFGLMLNELITNAYKHAFAAGRDQGEIRISLRQRDDEVVVCVADDGVGLPGDFDPDKLDSLGLRLVSALASQLKGRMTMDGRGGARFQIVFPSLGAPKKPAGGE